MTPKAFRALALTFPDAHEEPHFERVSFRVGKKIFATMTSQGDEAMVRSTPDAALALIEASPDRFFSYGGWTIKNGSLGVHLARVDAVTLRGLLTLAHGGVALRRSVGTSGKLASAMPAKTLAKKTKKAAPSSARAPHAGAAKDPRVDALLAKAPAYARPILEHLRAVVHEAVPEVREDVKWSRPTFMLDGTILCGMAAFNAHCTFGFWSPEMNAHLVADGIEAAARGGGGGSFGKISALSDLPPRRAMLGYVKKAAQLLRTGKATSPVAARPRVMSRPVIPMPDDLRAALAENTKASAVFEGFSPSHKREYLEWVTTAKRQETRDRRVTEAVARLAAGRAFNDAYRPTKKATR